MKRETLPIAVSMVLVFVICILISFMTGCTSSAQKKVAYWNSQIGIAKYDDVVRSLGPPTAKDTLSDGSIVAKWVRKSYATWGGSGSWTEEVLMRFSPGGILTQSITTRNAASCSQAAVQAAVDAAADGDIVQIPACVTTAWSTYVTVNNKAITIRGAGIGNTILSAAGDGSYSFYVPDTNTKMVKFYDMTLTVAGNQSCVSAPFYSCGNIKIDGGINGSPTFVVGRISFDHRPANSRGGFSARGVEITNGLAGLIHHWECHDVYACVFVFGTNDTAWAAPTGLGDANSVYIEDGSCNTSQYSYGACTESGSGGSYVFRYNTTSGNGTGQHGPCESGGRGHRRTEIYHNTFNAATGRAYDASALAGGTGVSFNNRYIGFSEPFHFFYKRACEQAECAAPYNKPCDGTRAIDGNQHPSGWRCRDALGTGKNQASEPFYSWNNCDQTVAQYPLCSDTALCDCGGASHVVNLVPASPRGCMSKLMTLIAENRDYYNQTIKPGYVPFTYPHPLQGAMSDY